MCLPALVAGAGCGPSSDAEAPPSAAVEEPSIYDLDITFTAATGATTRIADLAGRPVVAAMIYTSCSAVCPRITEDMKALERLLPERERRRVRFVLFSLDPESDTPEAMRGFAADHGLDPGTWTLLASSAEDVRMLAAGLGVRYRPEADGEIAHSATIFAIDSRGVMRHREEGLGRDPAALLAAIAKLE
jgi:protein SCO1/2